MRELLFSSSDRVLLCADIHLDASRPEDHEAFYRLLQQHARGVTAIVFL